MPIAAHQIVREARDRILKRIADALAEHGAQGRVFCAGCRRVEFTPCLLPMRQDVGQR